MKHLAIAFCLLTSFSALAQDVTTKKTIHIEPYLALSYDAFFKSLVLKSPDCSLEHLADFPFEWGYRYELKVQETILENPPMDGSSLTYKLLKVVSKEPTDSDFTFKLRLESDTYLGPGEQESTFAVINDSTYRYFDTVDLIIPENMRESFQKVLLPASSAQGEFRVIDSSTLELIMLQ
ncbi:MAG: DUF4377 domain-containing protein [Salibacteraceae bacterium]|nr:DUF4377 domain-containing protein [Salibacteraceae bacterium]